MPGRTERQHRRLRPLAVALLVGGLIGGLFAASPVAAVNNIAIVAFYGDCLFEGFQAGANKTVKIEWRDAEGNLKSRHSVTSNGGGDFVTRCEAAELIETGDVLKTTIGTSVRSFTVPKLTAAVDRDADTVSGKVQTNGLQQLWIEVYTYNGSFSPLDVTGHNAFETVSPDQGVQFYSATSWWDSAPDIRGWDVVRVHWMNDRASWIRVMQAEGMEVWSRQPFIRLAGNPGTLVSADLNTAPAGALRSEVDGRINASGSLGAWFTDADGDTVRVGVGNEVDADFASDAQLVVPGITATFNKTSDRVTVDCNIAETGSTGVEVVVYARDLSSFRTRTGFQSNAGGGTFLANFAQSPAFNVAAGSKVDVYCKFGTGDIVARTFTVP